MLYVAVMAGKNRCQCQKESHSPLIVGVRANTKQWQSRPMELPEALGSLLRAYSEAPTAAKLGRTAAPTRRL